MSLETVGNQEVATHPIPTLETSRKFAFFLGAGFSKWAAGLPTGNELFDFSIRVRGVRDQVRLERAKKAKADCDSYAENSNRGVEEFVAHVIATAPEKTRKAVLWYITRRLSEPFVYAPESGGGRRRQTYMIDEKWRLQAPGIVRATEFLKPFMSPACAGIVTTNYDLLVEYALGSAGFNYGIKGEPLRGRGPFRMYLYRLGPVSLTGPIGIAKLHGSVSWDSNGRYTDARGGVTGKCLIVAPAPEKTTPPELEATWRLARTILGQAKQIVFFGFGFNGYDRATLSLIQDSTTALERVLLVRPSYSSPSIPLSIPLRLRRLMTEVVIAKDGPDGIRRTRLEISDWIGQP